jgi:hypothetical protein
MARAEAQPKAHRYDLLAVEAEKQQALDAERPYSTESTRMTEASDI